MGRGLKARGTDNPTVQVTPEAKARLVEWLNSNDNPKMGVILTRVIDWFVSQPLLVQQVVLRRVPDPLRQDYARALREMAAAMEAVPAGEDHRPLKPQVSTSTRKG